MRFPSFTVIFLGAAVVNSMAIPNNNDLDERNTVSEVEELGKRSKSHLSCGLSDGCRRKREAEPEAIAAVEIEERTAEAEAAVEIEERTAEAEAAVNPEERDAEAEPVAPADYEKREADLDMEEFEYRA